MQFLKSLALTLLSSMALSFLAFVVLLSVTSAIDPVLQPLCFHTHMHQHLPDMHHQR